MMDEKVKWYWWKALPEGDLSILEKYPEFVHLSKKGKWSRIQYRSEEKVVYFRTEKIDCSTTLSKIMQLSKNEFKIVIVPLSPQFIVIEFVFLESFYCKICDETHSDWSVVGEEDGVVLLICNWCGERISKKI